ncbi:hypothetical protein Plec18167_009610 [Paecilomyces lecythidis]|uniref:Uncharacterized protein n=1 Tax=Paecilomyces lecythidis TaxID=3004212 RepID=A0ABR3WN93_9EURO
MSKPSLRPQSIQSRITHILNHWPSDPVRPASVSVQNYLQSKLSQAPSDKGSQTAPISQSSLDALSSLLEDRYARRYPLPAKLRRPASDPDHYDKVVQEFELAPSRDWWGRVTTKMRGLFRFK